MAVIHLERVSKRYGAGTRAVAALRDVTLDVAPGEMVAVTGPSGSGKSTLLMLVAGLDTPTDGRVVVEGQDLATLPDDARSDLRLRAIGFVFQTFHLLPMLTVEENVAWPLTCRGVRWREAKRRAASILAEVDLRNGARTRLPGELSGGEQQRVALARALITEPTLLLADEPTGNLDSDSARRILDLMTRLNVERGLTVILVTHNLEVARRGDRTIELRDGAVARSAP